MITATSASEASLILANAVPLFGVLLLGWSVLDIILLYWAESAIIGFFNILKLIKAPVLFKPKKSTQPFQLSPEIERGLGIFQKIFLVPFFMVHYGGFMAAHLVFIVFFFAPDLVDALFTSPSVLLRFSGLLIGFVGLFISHLLSFFTNYIGKEEYKKATFDSVMFAPYKRIFVMHLTIIFGAGIAVTSGNSMGFLFLLVIMKTGVDLYSHRKEHKTTIV